MAGQISPPTGHVFRVERARGPVWYAKYRLPDGRQVQKKIGPAWTGRGRPATGYVTKRLAEVIERWLVSFDGSARTRNKLLIQLHGILGRAKKVYGLRENAADGVEKFSQQRGGDIQVFSPEEVWALVRAASCEQDGAVFLTAAFTGLRMGELLGLRWRDVDFAGSTVRVRASYSRRALTTPKSGRVRAVPCRWRLMSPLPLLDWAAARTGWARTTWCSSGTGAAISTVRRCAGATRRRWSGRRCGL